MPEFLIELYVARTDARAVEAAGEQARLAAEALTAEGRPVRYLQSLFVPAEETCFHLYESGSLEDVRAAVARAGLPHQRIVEALTSTHATDKLTVHTDQRRRGFP